MTEVEWFSGESPWRMLDYLGESISERKLRLMACAACRLVIWPELTDRRSRHAIEIAERYADGAEKRQALIAAGRAAGGAARIGRRRAYGPAAAAADATLVNPRHAVNLTFGQVGSLPTACLVVREVIGNPFRRTRLHPRWLTSTAVALARTIYEDRAFDRLPILADALEEAGCDSPELLAHCRGDGPHVRGCWAVDLVLGRA